MDDDDEDDACSPENPFFCLSFSFFQPRDLYFLSLSLSPATTKPQAWPLVVVAGGAGLWYAKENGLLDDFLGGVPSSSSSSTAGARDYDAVRKAIAGLLDAEGYDDGSYGPVLVRLAWHCSGTYDAKTGTGGSNGAAMRFDPEASHGANAGLGLARSLLEPVKKKFPWISYADLYTLAGAVAIEEMGGPKIEWMPGRSDFVDGSASAKDSRLPDASQGAKHLRAVFSTGMGFDDREIVALSGAHSLGRCHADRSGFDGPWTRAPTTFSSLYFNELVSFEVDFFSSFFCFFFLLSRIFKTHEKKKTLSLKSQVNTKWTKRKWDGPLQYTNSASGDDLMMLPTDMVSGRAQKEREKLGLNNNKKRFTHDDTQKTLPSSSLSGPHLGPQVQAARPRLRQGRGALLPGLCQGVREAARARRPARGACRRGEPPRVKEQKKFLVWRKREGEPARFLFLCF